MSKALISAPSTASQGENAKEYFPGLKSAKGNVQWFSGNIAGLWLSGTIVSGKTTRLLLHNAGVKPKCIVVAPILTLAQAISASSIDIALAAASAATISGFYVIGSQPTNQAIKYAAYLQF